MIADAALGIDRIPSTCGRHSGWLVGHGSRPAFLSVTEPLYRLILLCLQPTRTNVQTDPAKLPEPSQVSESVRPKPAKIATP